MMNIKYPITLNLQSKGDLIVTKAGNAHQVASGPNSTACATNFINNPDYVLNAKRENSRFQACRCGWAYGGVGYISVQDIYERALKSIINYRPDW